MDNKSRNYLIKSVIKVLDIIEEMSKNYGQVRIKDLSEQIGIGQGTLHRFLSTLEYKGYVEQLETKGKYRLSLKLFEIGNNILQSMDLHSHSLPILQELNKQIGETVHLAVLDEGEVVFLNKIVSNPSFVTYSYVGKRAFAHGLALGKMLLSHLPEYELEKVINEKGLPRFTNNTITDIQKLKEKLVQIRHDGIAFDFEEYQPGVHCVAAPVKNHLGEVVAAVSVSGSLIALGRQRIKEVAKDVQKAAAKISELFGYKDSVF